MWMCTTEIANRNKPLGKAGGWGGVRGKSLPHSSWRPPLPFELLATFPGCPHFLLESSVPAEGWADETLGKRQDCHLNSWNDSPGTGSSWK